jgi:hypothetical protein
MMPMHPARYGNRAVADNRKEHSMHPVENFQDMAFGLKELLPNA